MHELALSRAALPAPVRCLGKTLLPYSIGHELWLIRENNSVLRGTLDGLPGAVTICSRTWAELSTIRSSRWLSLDMKLWHCRIRRMDKTAALKTFLGYRADGLLEFPVSQVSRADRQSARLPGCPFILRLQQWVMAHLGKSEAEAWDYPVGLAKMRWAAHWEQEGGLEIYNAHEAEADAHIAYWESRGGPGAMKEAKN